MAEFDFQIDTEYAIMLKNGGSVNILFSHVHKPHNTIHGWLFAAENHPEIQIAQSEICSVTRIPKDDVEKIKKITKEQTQRWNQQVNSIGVESPVGHYS